MHKTGSLLRISFFAQWGKLYKLSRVGERGLGNPSHSIMAVFVPRTDYVGHLELKIALSRNIKPFFFILSFFLGQPPNEKTSNG